MVDVWQYVTPDHKRSRRTIDRNTTTAIKAKWFHQQENGTLRTSTGHIPPPSNGRLRNFFCMTPWGSILSCSFLISGTIIFAIYAKKAYLYSEAIIQESGSVQNRYDRYLHSFLSSDIITSCLGVACILLGISAAWLHIRQLIKGYRWGHFMFSFSTTFFIVSIALLLGCIVWFLILSCYISSWMMAMWSLERPCQYGSEHFEPAIEPHLLQNESCKNYCIGFADFPFLQSTGCICDSTTAKSFYELSSNAKNCSTWVLVGLSCMVFGALISLVNVSADLGVAFNAWQMSALQEYCPSSHSNVTTVSVDSSPTQQQIPSYTPGSTQPRGSKMTA